MISDENQNVVSLTAKRIMNSQQELKQSIKHASNKMKNPVDRSRTHKGSTVYSTVMSNQI